MKSTTNAWPNPLLLAAMLGIVFLLTGVGCSTVSGPASASFASVVIDQRSQEQIAAATMEVFAADGYVGAQTGPGQMLFEKEASRGTTMMREGFMATQAGAATINRVRVEIVNLSGGQRRLQCKAFMVTGGSDPFFQDEVPVSNLRRAPYQLLLEKVKKQLE